MKKIIKFVAVVVLIPILITVIGGLVVKYDREIFGTIKDKLWNISRPVERKLNPGYREEWNFNGSFNFVFKKHKYEVNGSKE